MRAGRPIRIRSLRAPGPVRARGPLRARQRRVRCAAGVGGGPLAFALSLLVVCFSVVTLVGIGFGLSTAGQAAVAALRKFTHEKAAEIPIAAGPRTYRGPMFVVVSVDESGSTRRSDAPQARRVDVALALRELAKTARPSDQYSICAFAASARCTEVRSLTQPLDGDVVSELLPLQTGSTSGRALLRAVEGRFALAPDNARTLLVTLTDGALNPAEFDVLKPLKRVAEVSLVVGFERAGLWDRNKKQWERAGLAAVSTSSGQPRARAREIVKTWLRTVGAGWQDPA